VEVTGRGRVASENFILTAQSVQQIKKNEMGMQHTRE
jgi:hypothetical protein